jgi:hypothetical protein
MLMSRMGLVAGLALLTGCGDDKLLATAPHVEDTTEPTDVPELPEVRGAIAFASATSPDLWKPATASSIDVPITIIRTPPGASDGALSTHLQVTFGPCGPADQSVGFAAGESGSKVITLSATAGGACGIRVILDDADTSPGAITSTFVTIVAEDPSTLRGAIAFPSATLPDAIWASSRITWVEIPVTIVRTPEGARNGALATQLEVTSGPCEPASQTVGFADGEAGAKLVMTTGDTVMTAPGTNAIRATALGECRIRVIGGDAATEAGAITSTVVRILAAPDPGATCINSAGQAIPYPTNARVQELFPGGTNNYVYDSPAGMTIVMPLVMSRPTNWGPNGEVLYVPCTAQELQFTTAAANIGPLWVQTQGGQQIEIAFSKCPGDFEYYKTEAASYFCDWCGGEYHRSYQPCGQVGYFGATPLYWTTGEPNMAACSIPKGEQWYMNARFVQGICDPQFSACGATFYMPDWCTPEYPTQP